MTPENTPRLETNRLILRKFTEQIFRPCLNFSAIRKQTLFYLGFP